MYLFFLLLAITLLNTINISDAFATRPTSRSGSKKQSTPPKRIAKRPPGFSSSSKTTSSKSTIRNKDNNNDPDDDEGIRLNKCIPSLSRRAADTAIAEGRVKVNGELSTSAGVRIRAGDKVMLDDKIQHWKNLQKAKTSKHIATNRDKRKLVYLKYYKPPGITSTSDQSDPTNIINAGRFELFPQRLFTVGRLDKDSTGLILLTSDGRLNNAMLDPKEKKSKIYEVTLDKVISEEHLQKLRSGVTITTPVQRKGKRDVTARTRPCTVTRIPQSQTALTFILTEGRNRQIRRMCESLGYNVIHLHRTSFAGIDISGLSSNEWSELTEDEIKIIRNILKKYDDDNGGSGSSNSSDFEDCQGHGID